MARISNEELIEQRRRVVKGVLTVREFEMLALAAEGLVYQEIAGRVGLSRGTVGETLRYVFERLGARNLAHCINVAYERGLFAAPAPAAKPEPGSASFRRVGLVHRAVDPPLV